MRGDVFVRSSGPGPRIVAVAPKEWHKNWVWTWVAREAKAWPKDGVAIIIRRADADH